MNMGKVLFGIPDMTGVEARRLSAHYLRSMRLVGWLFLFVFPMMAGAMALVTLITEGVFGHDPLLPRKVVAPMLVVSAIIGVAAGVRTWTWFIRKTKRCPGTTRELLKIALCSVKARKLIETWRQETEHQPDPYR